MLQELTKIVQNEYMRSSPSPDIDEERDYEPTECDSAGSFRAAQDFLNQLRLRVKLQRNHLDPKPGVVELAKSQNWKEAELHSVGSGRVAEPNARLDSVSSKDARDRAWDQNQFPDVGIADDNDGRDISKSDIRQITPRDSGSGSDASLGNVHKHGN